MRKGIILTKGVSPEAASTNPYYTAPEKSPNIDWEWMLVVEPVPELWQERFGPNTSKRFAGAFIGGAAMMLGARLAQGGTSGHGISGALQLALSRRLPVSLNAPAPNT